MNTLPPKNHFLSSIIGFIDSACLILSPFAIFLFFFLVIVVLDAFGSHVQFVAALDEDGIVETGIWNGISSDHKWGYVTLLKPAEEMNGDNTLLIPLQYYPEDILANLKEGQHVPVRYALNRVEAGVKGVLENEFVRVRYSPSFISPYFLILLLCWSIIVIHPEFIFIGLPDINDKNAKASRESL